MLAQAATPRNGLKCSKPRPSDALRIAQVMAPARFAGGKKGLLLAEQAPSNLADLIQS
jgi:hypothetical protein